MLWQNNGDKMELGFIVILILGLYLGPTALMIWGDHVSAKSKEKVLPHVPESDNQVR